MQNVDRRTKPSLHSLVAAPGLVELVDLFLKYGQNGRGRVAFLEPGGERIGSEIPSSLLFICLESFFEDGVEIGSRHCRYGRLGGWARCGRLTHAEALKGDADAHGIFGTC
jgi:hypothetical protein